MSLKRAQTLINLRKWKSYKEYGGGGRGGGGYVYACVRMCVYLCVFACVSVQGKNLFSRRKIWKSFLDLINDFLLHFI